MRGRHFACNVVRECIPYKSAGRNKSHVWILNNVCGRAHLNPFALWQRDLVIPYIIGNLHNYSIIRTPVITLVMRVYILGTLKFVLVSKHLLSVTLQILQFNGDWI